MGGEEIRHRLQLNSDLKTGHFPLLSWEAEIVWGLLPPGQVGMHSFAGWPHPPSKWSSSFSDSSQLEVTLILTQAELDWLVTWKSQRAPRLDLEVCYTGEQGCPEAWPASHWTCLAQIPHQESWVTSPYCGTPPLPILHCFNLRIKERSGELWFFNEAPFSLEIPLG